jgi:16S rRNA G966 N2-methylase RsmD
VRIIGDNLRSTGFSGVGQAFINTVRAAIEILARRGQQFDFIFLDPPYEKGWIALTLGWLARTPLLAPSGVIIVEHSRREPVTDDLFVVRREASHGDSRLTFLAAKEDV